MQLLEKMTLIAAFFVGHLASFFELSANHTNSLGEPKVNSVLNVIHRIFTL